MPAAVILAVTVALSVVLVPEATRWLMAGLASVGAVNVFHRLRESIGHAAVRGAIVAVAAAATAAGLLTADGGAELAAVLAFWAACWLGVEQILVWGAAWASSSPEAAGWPAPASSWSRGRAVAVDDHAAPDPEIGYRAGDARGEPGAAFNLGELLARRGDRLGAEAAFRRADERGHAAAAYSLGQRLRRRGDLDEAEAAYRRAGERGHSGAAYMLGLVASERGDAAATVAPQRAREVPQAHTTSVEARVAVRPAPASSQSRGRVAAVKRHAAPDPEVGYRAGDARGEPGAAFNLGELLAARGDGEGAEAAFRRADERGHAAAAYGLGQRLRRRGDLDEAEAAYRRAGERGHPGAAYMLALVASERGVGPGTIAPERVPDVPRKAESRRRRPSSTPATPPPAAPREPAVPPIAPEAFALRDELDDAAPTFGRVIESSLRASYGVDWLAAVNTRRRKEGRDPLVVEAVRWDPRAQVALIGYEPALKPRFGAMCGRARLLSGIATTVHHNPRAAEPGRVRAAREVFEQLRRRAEELDAGG